MPPADNSRYLVEASKQRHHQARELAQQAIEGASRRGGRPTVTGIAAAAGVSRSWLYTQDDLMAAIAELQRRRGAPQRAGQATSATEESLRRRLETSLERNRQMREEIRDLHRRLEAAHGEVRRLRALAGNGQARPEESIVLAELSPPAGARAGARASSPDGTS